MATTKITSFLTQPQIEAQIDAKVQDITEILLLKADLINGIVPDNELPAIIIIGYYYAGVFWRESSHINRLPYAINKIYIDEPTHEIYFFDSSSEQFKKIISVAEINGAVPGLVKIYDTRGQNTDGTMTQKAITDGLASKVGIDTDELSTEECLKFVLD